VNAVPVDVPVNRPANGTMNGAAVFGLLERLGLVGPRRRG
jgi:hypothetical protein